MFPANRHVVVVSRKRVEVLSIAEIYEKLGTLFGFPLQFYPSFWTEIGIGRSASSEHPRILEPVWPGSDGDRVSVSITWDSSKEPLDFFTNEI